MKYLHSKNAETFIFNICTQVFYDVVQLEKLKRESAICHFIISIKHLDVYEFIIYFECCWFLGDHFLHFVSFVDVTFFSFFLLFNPF